MRFALISALAALALAAPSTVKAGTTTTSDNRFCKIETSIISKLKSQAVATSYCSSFLHITTVYITSTTTVIPDFATKTQRVTVTGTPITRPVTTQVTSTVVTTPTSTEEETSYDVTTQYVIQTCLFDGDHGNAVAARATLAAAPRPAAFPSKAASSFISKACSCLSLQTPTRRTQVSVTLPRQTYTSTLAVTTNPVKRPSTTTLVTTFTSTAAATTTTTTTTVTFVAYARDPVPIGLSYVGISHDFTSYPNGGGFNAKFFKDASDYAYAGRTENLDFATSNESPFPLDLHDSFGPPIENSTHIGVLLTGYFLPNQTGTYTFSTDKNLIDNWGYLWAGDDAYTAWNDDNAKYKASHMTTDDNPTGGSFSFNVKAGAQYPVRFLWANGGYRGQNDFKVTFPNGKTVSDTSNLFIPPCAFGTGNF